MRFKDVNGDIHYYYGDIILNEQERNYKRLSYSNMLKVFADGCYIFNNKVANKFDFDFVDDSLYNTDIEIYQYYIISKYVAEKLQKCTNEIILYNDELDIYLLGVIHYGTSWDYVLTDIEIMDY